MPALLPILAQVLKVYEPRRVIVVKAHVRVRFPEHSRKGGIKAKPKSAQRCDPFHRHLISREGLARRVRPVRQLMAIGHMCVPMFLHERIHLR